MIHLTSTNCLKWILFFWIFQLSSISASIDQFQTTRLKSTAGAGVGSILMDEATILNPAPLAFFNVSSIYFQRSGGDLSSDSNNAITESSASSTAFIISDSKGPAGGSLSYIDQTESSKRIKRISASLSSSVGQKSAIGTTYRMTKLEDSLSGVVEEKSFKQFIIGVTHAISDSLSLGLVVIDPSKVIPEETRGIVGIQYVFNDFISVMGDAGADYNLDLSETFLYRGALQFKVYQDFYLRFGVHQDKGLQEKGSGIGIGWVQPRLVLDVALRNLERNKTTTLSENTQNFKETSFSASYRF
jgi:hypothetical protein